MKNGIDRRTIYYPRQFRRDEDYRTSYSVVGVSLVSFFVLEAMEGLTGHPCKTDAISPVRVILQWYPHSRNSPSHSKTDKLEDRFRHSSHLLTCTDLAY